MKDTQQILKTLYSGTQIEFKVKDSNTTVSEILNTIIEHYGVFHDGLLWGFRNNTWYQRQPELELSISYSNIVIEGDILVKGESLSITQRKIAKRIEEELPEITSSTQAYYDLTLEIYDLEYNKSYVVLHEIQIGQHKEGYKVIIEFRSIRSLNTDRGTDRFSDLDYKDSTSSDNRDIPEDNRYKTLDLDPVGKKNKRFKDKPDSRFTSLDLNSLNLHKDFEDLLFQQDTQQDQVQTAQQKLGKQQTSVQVSKSIQSQVDKMSYQKAYDAIEEAKKAWDDTDAYDQYTDTVELASKWYGDNLVLVDSFDIIDKIYYAADLTKKIAKLEDEIANTKSRATVTKLKKELDQLNKDLSNITPQIQSSLHGSKGYSAIENKAEELEEKMEDYIEDYQSNLAEWKALQDKMSKAGKMIEIMEALKSKYADNLDLPPLLYRYKSLMETPDLNVLYTAWRKSMNDYRKELQSFNDSFQDNYEALSRILALKSKSRSLF